MKCIDVLFINSLMVRARIRANICTRATSTNGAINYG